MIIKNEMLHIIYIKVIDLNKGYYDPQNLHIPSTQTNTFDPWKESREKIINTRCYEDKDVLNIFIASFEKFVMYLLT